jgi:hypothetical protein
MKRSARWPRLLCGGLCTLILLLAAAWLPPAGAAAAADAPPAAAPVNAPLYDVEMVVFRAVTAGNAEDWSVVPPGRGFGSSSSRGGPAPDVVRVLGASDYRLDGVVDDLRVSGTWRPVAHAAWIQTAPPWGTHVGVPLSQLGVNVPGLSGTVYLERAPMYLHLGFDVSLTSGATYMINEMRNVRQNEKQYYDHPAFGIIAVVTQIKQSVR